MCRSALLPAEGRALPRTAAYREGRAGLIECALSSESEGTSNTHARTHGPRVRQGSRRHDTAPLRPATPCRASRTTRRLQSRALRGATPRVAGRRRRIGGPAAVLCVRAEMRVTSE